MKIYLAWAHMSKNTETEYNGEYKETGRGFEDMFFHKRYKEIELSESLPFGKFNGVEVSTKKAYIAI